MARKRFLVLYTPRDKIVAAAEANGWTEDGGESLLDAVGDHFSFEEEESRHSTLEAAVERAKTLVETERDLFGETTVDEQDLHMETDLDFGGVNVTWETVARHHVDETGLIETVDCEAAA